MRDGAARHRPRRPHRRLRQFADAHRRARLVHAPPFRRRQVAILDGGFQKWLAEGRPDRKRRAAAAPARFDAASAAARSSPSSDMLAGLGAAARRARQGRGSKAARPIRGPASPPAISRAPATCRSASLYKEDGTFRPPDEIRATVRRSRASIRRSRSSPPAVRASPPTA